jgi:hypothetical protein
VLLLTACVAFLLSLCQRDKSVVLIVLGIFRRSSLSFSSSAFPSGSAPSIASTRGVAKTLLRDAAKDKSGFELQV